MVRPRAGAGSNPDLSLRPHRAHLHLFLRIVRPTHWPKTRVGQGNFCMKKRRKSWTSGVLLFIEAIGKELLHIRAQSCLFSEGTAAP